MSVTMEVIIMKKRGTSRIIAVLLSVIGTISLFSNTVSAQTIESIPAGLSQKEVTPRGLVSLPAGTYYCLSTGRSDSYINISTDGISCTFNNVYSTEKNSFVSGSGKHTYSASPSFTFYLTSWTYNGQSTVHTGPSNWIYIETTYSGGDFILANGEIYVRS